MSKITVGLPEESSISRRARELMQAAAQMRGAVYVEPPPRVPRVDLERKRQEKEMLHTVYFLYCCDRIKIGSASHLPIRMEQLQNASPLALILVKALAGGKTLEAKIHRRFDDACVGGEWFWLSPALREFILEDNCLAGKLKKAEEGYLNFLRDELKYMEEMHADQGD
jgi:Meiotically up-regulated gene 113